MKKNTTLLTGLLLATLVSYAGGDWATSAVMIKLTDSTAYYKLNDQGWTDGIWGGSTAFNALDFGTPDTLILNGAAGNGWTDDSPGYDATSFKLYYRVYLSSGSAGDWSVLDLTNMSYQDGNNRIYERTDTMIDILALATENGTNEYTLELAMSKNQYYDGGNWNSMIPDGQATAYSADNAGYKAVFTVTNAATRLQDVNNFACNVYSNNNRINLSINSQKDQLAKVSVINLAGQVKARFSTVLTSGHSNITLPSSFERGLYLINIETDQQQFTNKIVVR